MGRPPGTAGAAGPRSRPAAARDRRPARARAARPGRRCRPRRRAAPTPAAACAPSRWTRWSAGTKTTGRSAGDTGSRTAVAGPSAGVQARVSPPSRQAATLSGWPSSSAASPSSAASSSVSSPPSTSARAGDQAGDDGRGGRAEPAAVRDAVRADDLEAAGLPAERVEAGLQRAHHQVPPGARHGLRALPGHVDVQALVGDPDDHVVVQGEGQAERVEAGPEVGAGGGHPDPHRRGPERGPGSARRRSPHGGRLPGEAVPLVPITSARRLAGEHRWYGVSRRGRAQT